ncbi:DUF3307 domain-containing protein [Ornithobacterium rhinotracheale]|uniref:DUF3307 domain-containing protein n=1 Tax=Ornithobacterium rhinotracheale TaxID=28251 RepID=UPI00129CC0D1|nr:DUF3307 domain-containing protein [Ornithobacterium rhinotracheale]MRJ10957.1 DUF3307 domain-containing protein [Ornithobacterium rhinotracheale]
MYQYLLSLFLLYLFTEFFIPPIFWSKNPLKQINATPKFLLHLGIVLILSIPIFYYFKNYWTTTLWVVGAFLLIDLVLFLMKQKSYFYRFLYSQITKMAIFTFLLFPLFYKSVADEQIYRVAIVLLAYLLSTSPASILISSFLDQKKLNSSDSSPSNSWGKYIGVLERLLILTFIFLNEFPPIGFLIIAKFLYVIFANSHRDKNQISREITGSLFSILIAILVGIIFNTFII